MVIVITFGTIGWVFFEKFPVSGKEATINFTSTNSLEYDGTVVFPITTPLDAIHFILKKEHESIKKQMDENRPQSRLKINAVFMDEKGKRRYYDLYRTRKKNNIISQEEYEQFVSEMEKKQSWWEVYVFATSHRIPTYSCQFAFFESGETNSEYNEGCRWKK